MSFFLTMLVSFYLTGDVGEFLLYLTGDAVGSLA